MGKLNCRNCSARLGGFDFIHHFECPCGRDAAIHLNKSRVDPEHKRCFLTLQPKMRKEQSHLLRVEPQTEESSRPASHAGSATPISAPAGASCSLWASESSRLFSFSPLDCVRKRRQRSLEDAAPLRSSCWCSAGPTDTPSAWVMPAGTDERAHASPALPPQPDSDGQASVSSCPLPPSEETFTCASPAGGGLVFCGDLSCPGGHSESRSHSCHGHRGRGAGLGMSCQS